MSGKEFSFSGENKKWAFQNSDGFGGRQRKDIHHIVPCSVAKKYHLDKSKITSKENAIALERNTFHKEIHKIFEEDDYIFLAISLLGFEGKDFEQEYPVRSSKKKRRKKGGRRR